MAEPSDDNSVFRLSDVSNPESTRGWQGAACCSNLAEAWSCHPCIDSEVSFQEMLTATAKNMDRKAGMQIDAALQLNQPKLSAKRQGGRASDQPQLADVLQLPDIDAYAFDIGRARLSSILRAFTSWKPLVGYNPVLASLAASIMAVMGSERLTFKCIVQVYKRYQLDDYFTPSQGSEPAAKQDAHEILKLAASDWPDLAHAFIKYNGVNLFLDLAQNLLSTLLTSCYCPSKQNFQCYARLLHHIVMPTQNCSPEDPRRQLRHVVLGILLRNQSAFLRCRDLTELRELTHRIRQHVHVDVPLLKLVAWQDQEYDIFYRRAASLAAPVGALFGGFLASDHFFTGVALGSSFIHMAQGALVSGGCAILSGMALSDFAARWAEECSHDLRQSLLMEVERED